MGYVQTAGYGNGAVSPVTSGPFPQPTTSGNTIVVTIADDLTNMGAVTLTDTYGNAYYRVLGTITGGPWPTTLTMFYATNITGGTGHTLTATFAPLRWPGENDHCRFVAQEFTGVLIPERSSARTDTTIAATSGATEATTQQRETVVGGLAVESTALPTIGIGEGFSKMAFASAAPCSFAQQSRETETIGTQESTFTVEPSQAWAAGVIAFASPPARPAAGFTRVQSASNGGVTTSVSVTLPQAPTPGNLLVCWWVSGSACTLTNSGWTAGPRVDANVGSAMYYKIATSADSATVTFTLSRNDVTAGFVEYAGNTAAPFDKQATSSVFNDNGAYSITPVSAETTAANDLVVSLAALRASVTAGYPTSPSWTGGLANVLAQGDGQSSASNVTCYSFYGDNLNAGPAGTTSAQASWSTTQFKQRTGLAMTFQAAPTPVSTRLSGAFFDFL